MKRRTKRVAICLLALLMLVTQSACWSSHQINGLAFITLLGIDKGEEDGNYRLSVLVSLPQGGGASSSGGPTKKKSVMMSADSPSLLEAMRKIQTSLSKKTYWAHNLVVIFGESAAKENVALLLDMFVRQYDFRIQTPMVVTRGRAEDLFAIKPQLQDSLGAEIAGLVENSEYSSTTYVQDIARFLYAFSSETQDPMTALLSGKSEEGVILTNKPDSSLLSLDGSAVFKGGKLVGFLNADESRGVLWVKGKVKKGAIRFDCPQQKKGQVNAHFTTEDSSLSVVMRGGEPEIDIKVHVITEISEISCPSLKLDPDRIDEFREEIEKKVNGEIESALDRVQRGWQVDPFAFGEAIWRRYPSVWKKLAPSWHEAGLKELKVNVSVRAINRRSGLINDTASGGR